MNLLFVFLGGGAGSLMRYLIGIAIPFNGKFPLATLTANVLAALVLAVFIAFPLSHATRLLLITGFCGGLSTFSTFSNETVLLVRNQQWSLAAMNVFLNVAICCLIIYALSKSHFSR